MYDVAHASEIDAQKERREYETVGQEANAIIRCACAPCNQGWMERLDGRAQPLIEPMVFGNPTTLGTLGHLATVAAWATKVAMCLASTVCVTRPSREEASAFRQHNVPPAGYRLRIGAADIEWPNLWLSTIQLLPHKGADPTGVEAYASTFRVGHVVFQVFAPSQTIREESERSQWQGRTSELWPTFTQMRWSTATAFDSVDLALFSRAYVAD